MDGAAGRRRGACPHGTKVHTTDTRCKRRDGAWAGETNVHGERTDVRGRAWSGGAVFAAVPRRSRGPLCENGDATGAGPLHNP